MLNLSSMKRAILLKSRGTILEVAEVDGKRVRVRYVAPVESDVIREWYDWYTLLAAGWREVKP